MFTHVGGMQGAIEQGELTLQVSGNVACLLLEKVRETMSDYRYHLGGFDANYSNDREVIQMATRLEKDLKDTEKLVKDEEVQHQSSSDALLSNQGRSDYGGNQEQQLDKKYMEKLINFSDMVKSNPQKQHEDDGYFD